MPGTYRSPTERSTEDARIPGRRTPQRRSLLEALMKGHDFLSAQSLHNTLRLKGVHVGLSTVYRTLAAFCEAGLADVVRDSNGERLFRYRPSRGHQHYLLCRSCGFSAPVESTAVEAWAQAIADTSDFAEVEHTVELTGICGDCLHDARRTDVAGRPASELSPDAGPAEAQDSAKD
ncbi:Fur family transcriptional regulator [Streptomyces polygonati]|uniref:Fur family transcriptional regulator n=1 Tax=Streptomyces polygonati TaxID=1617087 RepID=A0ABV8HRV5_9ACTN